MTRGLVIAGMLLVCTDTVRAGNEAQDPGVAAGKTESGSATPSAKAAKPKPKKVWTEDNLGEAGGTVSVVGDGSVAPKGQAAHSQPAKSAGGKPADESGDARAAGAVRERLKKLQLNLAQVDQQIAELKGFSKGDAAKPAGLKTDTWHYNSSSVEEQLRHLQEKKRNLQTAIDDLLDAARKSGIEPGQLR